MVRSSFLSILIVTSSFILAIGQTPETKKEKEKADQVFSWAFEGDGAYLGVQAVEITRENFAKFGLSVARGVAVDKVMENSPAAAAGLQAGDVILRFNGEEVTGTRKFSRMVAETAPDHRVSLTISRGGREQEVSVTVGKNPHGWSSDRGFTFSMPDHFEKLDLDKFKFEHDLKDLPALKDHFQLFKDMPRTFNLPQGGESFAWRAGEGRQIGVSVYTVTKQLGERFGTDGGVMISEVRENSPAAKAGLRAGDIIVEIGGKVVKSNIDLIRSINEKKEGDVQLTVVRDGNRQTIKVTPEPSKESGFFFHDDKDTN